MKKIKIIYIEGNIDGTVGGSHFSLLFLIEGLDKQTYDPIVAFYQDNYLIQQYKNAGCRVMIIKKRKPLNVIQTLLNLKVLKKYSILNTFIIQPVKLLQKLINYFLTFIIPSFKCWLILKNEKIDLVHLNNTILRPQEWILASIFTKSKIIAHERGINTVFPAQSLFWARYLSAIICISSAVKDNLLKRRIPENKLIKIYNALDPERFIVRKNKEDVLKEFGLTNGTHLIGIVGNIKEWKGQKTVISAIKYIRKRYPDVQCMIIGGVSNSDMYYLKCLKEIVKMENLKGKVIFTGQRKDVPDLVNCLSILIHASIEPEPFGRILLEGMALRKPIISTSIGAPIEIVIEGKTGFLVSPGKPEELARAIQKLFDDRSLAEEMGNVGYDRLLKEFSLKKNVELTENLYRSILS